MERFAIFAVGFGLGFGARILWEKYNEPEYEEVYVDTSEMPVEGSVIDSETSKNEIRVDNVVHFNDNTILTEIAPEYNASKEKLDPQFIPYGEGCRLINDKEFGELCTDDNVESIELVYFVEDNMVSEEGDIFSTMSPAEARKLLGDKCMDMVVNGELDEFHFYNDLKYILYTVTRYEGAWGDIAAYAGAER